MTNSGRRHSSAAERVCAALVLALSLASSACMRSESTPVARGEYYAAGHPDYDEFFVRLYRYQLDTNAAVNAERSARAELALALDAPAAQQDDEIAPRLQERAAELNRKGLRLVLLLDKPAPAPAAELTLTGEPSAAEQDAIAALRASTLRLAEVKRSAAASITELDRMRVEAVELERAADKVFWKEGLAKRNEVKENLSDARKLLLLMSDRRKALASRSGEILQTLARAFPPPPAEKASPPAEQKRARRSKRGATKPGAQPAAKPKRSAAAAPTTPPPRTAPPKAAAPKADFEP